MEPDASSTVAVRWQHEDPGWSFSNQFFISPPARCLAAPRAGEAGWSQAAAGPPPAPSFP